MAFFVNPDCDECIEEIKVIEKEVNEFVKKITLDKQEHSNHGEMLMSLQVFNVLNEIIYYLGKAIDYDHLQLAKLYKDEEYARQVEQFHEIILNSLKEVLSRTPLLNENSNHITKAFFEDITLVKGCEPGNVYERRKPHH